MFTVTALALLVAPQVAITQQPTVESLGATLVSPTAPPLAGTFLDGRFIEVTLNLPSQAYQEPFVLGLPFDMQVPAPMLTLFHGYGETHLNVKENTTLAEEALSRGWIVVIPLGAHIYNYGIDYAQENIEQAVELVASALPVDMDRVYGVGFSMGGGAGASYAARHLDPTRVQFAAFVNHTGTTSLRAAYQTSGVPTQTQFESPLMFGGPPETATFRYQRSSSIDMDSILGTIDPRGALGSNLNHIPIQHWYATMDANVAIVDQTIALHEAMEEAGANTELVPRSLSTHSWSTLDTGAVLDWLEPQRLARPAVGDVTRTVADRDGAWHDLEIKQGSPNALTPIIWTVQPQANAFYAIDTENLAEVAIDAETAGLSRDATLGVVFQSKDTFSTDIVLRGIDQSPSAVTRQGQGSSSWTYDAATSTLTLQELGGAPGWARWTIEP